MTDTPSRVKAFAAVGADQDAVFPASPNLRLFGWSVREVGAAVATGKIKNAATGAAAAATAVGEIGLAAAGEKDVWLGPNGILCENGISIDWLTGSFDIEIYANGG